MRSEKPHKFPSNASGVGLVFGEEQRRRAWRNIGLNGNLLFPFIFHFQPRVMDCLSLIFFFKVFWAGFVFLFFCFTLIQSFWSFGGLPLSVMMK